MSVCARKREWEAEQPYDGKKERKLLLCYYHWRGWDGEKVGKGRGVGRCLWHQGEKGEGKSERTTLVSMMDKIREWRNDIVRV